MSSVCADAYMQASTLIAERDSMASHNMTLASTTSRLIAATAGATTQQDAADAPSQTLAEALGAGFDSSSGWDTFGMLDGGFAGAQRSASAPGGPNTASAGGNSAAQGQGRAPQQSVSAAPSVGGAVNSPSQAREIGTLLTRLTNENTQFLKARDAAVASRNEALNRAAALETELELRQQQLRYGRACVCQLHASVVCISGLYLHQSGG